MVNSMDIHRVSKVTVGKWQNQTFEDLNYSVKKIKITDNDGNEFRINLFD